MPLTARYETALAFAARLHANQIRKQSGVPYIAHLLSVSALVLEHGGTEDEAIGGLLHDAVEDQGGMATHEVIKRLFGPEVAAIVLGCTDAVTIPKPPWRERKEVYIKHLAEVSDSVRLVSCADKLHNARSIVADLRIVGNKVWTRFTGGQAGSLWYYQALADAFTQHGPPVLAAELRRTVQEMARLAAEFDAAS